MFCTKTLAKKPFVHATLRFLAMMQQNLAMEAPTQGRPVVYAMFGVSVAVFVLLATLATYPDATLTSELFVAPALGVKSVMPNYPAQQGVLAAYHEVWVLPLGVETSLSTVILHARRKIALVSPVDGSNFDPVFRLMVHALH